MTRGGCENWDLSNLVVPQPPKAYEGKFSVKTVPVIAIGRIGSPRGNFVLFRDVRKSLENSLAPEVTLVSLYVRTRGGCGFAIKAYSESIGPSRKAWA